jgi:hypothetical protein
MQKGKKAKTTGKGSSATPVLEEHDAYYPNKKYATLARVCVMAMEQASAGKGKERHADGNLRFEEQDIVRDARFCGLAAPIFQVRKKAKEALRLPPEMAIQELLGCMVYAAGAIIAIEIDHLPKSKG